MSFPIFLQIPSGNQTDFFLIFLKKTRNVPREMLKLTCDYKDDYSSGEPSENRHLPQGDRRLRQTKGRSEECLQHHHVSTNAGGHEDEEER